MNLGSREASADLVAAFRRGLAESDYDEGKNVTVEYHWLDGQPNRMPALLDDLIRRHVAVIATPGATSITIAAKQRDRHQLFKPGGGRQATGTAA
jgi:putative tryptophan/tyrosine transport system substrate-binding protein